MKTDTRWGLIVAALIVVAALRVAATYYTVSATVDEPPHIACGLEWLEGKTYNYEYQHPPLARMVLGLGLYLDGIRAPHLDDFWSDGNAILYSDDNYRARLALARVGNLAFLILGAVVVGLWGKRWFGRASGLWGVLLFVSLPPILAHAGLATLDMAATATCGLALYELVRWREQPTMRRALVLAVAVALGLLCKFSIPAFLVASAAIGLFGIRRGDAPPLQGKPLCGQAAAMLGVVLLLVWVGYRFHVQPVVEPDDSRAALHDAMARIVGDRPAVLKVMTGIFEIPTPLGGLVRGFGELLNHDAKGQTSYLLGQARRTGWWYFFPVVLSVKTPIGFGLLALFGMVLVFFGFRDAPWQHRVTALFVLAILLVCMTSRIDRGVRHVLPIYTPLAVMAGSAAAALFSQKQTRWVAVVLAGWVAVASVIAHPDYLPYFNEIALSHPEKILVDSDLDWGQDLDRLSARLRELHVDHVGIQYWGGGSLARAGLPPYTKLQPNEITEGYVAISLHELNTYYAANGSWAWLHDRQPVERIGKSINLYYIKK
jgi:hypothetical protein